MAFAAPVDDAPGRSESVGHVTCEILVDVLDGAGRLTGCPHGGPSAVTPSAARLTESLRDIGYDFPAAVADIVDNSIMAGAARVEILIEFDGAELVGLHRRRRLRDDGERAGRGAAVRNPAHLRARGSGALRAGTEDGVVVAVPFGDRGDPQTRNRRPRMAVRMLDLDLIAEWDEWLVVEPGRDPAVAARAGVAGRRSGTVVIWRKLDRVLPEKRPDGGWARRRLEAMAAKTAEHLGIVFHRFLEGTD